MFVFLQNFFTGVLLTIGDFTPGVGRQTVAVILGVYNEILDFLSQLSTLISVLFQSLLTKKSKVDVLNAFRQINWKFGLAVITGAIVPLVFFAPIITAFYTAYPVQIMSITFGLILATVAIPVSEIRVKTAVDIGISLLIFLVFFYLFGIVTTAILFPTLPLFLFGGVLVSVALFIPGVTSAVVFPILGIYLPTGELTLYSFSAKLLFYTGVFIGFFGIIKLLSFLNTNFKQQLLAFFSGILAASLRLVWPFLENGRQLAPWEIHLTAFTQQIIFIGVSFAVVSSLRILAQRQKMSATSFGEAKRIVINS